MGLYDSPVGGFALSECPVSFPQWPGKYNKICADNKSEKGVQDGVNGYKSSSSVKLQCHSWTRIYVVCRRQMKKCELYLVKLLCHSPPRQYLGGGKPGHTFDLEKTLSLILKDGSLYYHGILSCCSLFRSTHKWMYISYFAEYS